MYTIKEICSGASMMVRSVLGRKREYRIQFNKDWYVDFPHWPFSHDSLAMVSGAAAAAVEAPVSAKPADFP